MTKINGNQDQPLIRSYDLVKNGKLELGKNHKQDVINFNKIDKNRDGKIDSNEFYNAINEQLKDANDKMAKMQKGIDDFSDYAGRDQTLNVDEYQRMIDDKRFADVNESLPRTAPFTTEDASGFPKFNNDKFMEYASVYYDDDKDGKLTGAQFKKLLEDTGMELFDDSPKILDDEKYSLQGLKLYIATASRLGNTQSKLKPEVILENQGYNKPHFKDNLIRTADDFNKLMDYEIKRQEILEKDSNGDGLISYNEWNS